MNFIKYNSFILLFCVGYLPATQYKIVDIGTPSVKTNVATSINQKGQVAGTCSGSQNQHLFLWDELNGFTFFNGSGTVAKPGYPPYVNDNGIVSMKVINNNGDTYLVSKENKLYKNNTLIESSVKWRFNESIAVKANNNGQIIGNLENNTNSIVLYDEKTKKINYITSPLKHKLTAEGINDLGWIIGSYYDGVDHNGILWTPEFGIQVLHGFRPIAINNLGIIVGITIPAGDIWQDHTRAVLWDKGTLIDLSKELKIDTDPTTKILWLSSVSGINDSNQMCGWGPTIKNTPGDRQPVFITPIIK